MASFCCSLRSPLQSTSSSPDEQRDPNVVELQTLKPVAKYTILPYHLTGAVSYLINLKSSNFRDVLLLNCYLQLGEVVSYSLRSILALPDLISI